MRKAERSWEQVGKWLTDTHDAYVPNDPGFEDLLTYQRQAVVEHLTSLVNGKAVSP